jgi:hypothetical protein
VVVMDIDLSYSPDHIGRMLAKIRETRAKVVVASPYMEGGKVSNVPWLRKTLSKWANRFLSLTATRDKFSDKLSTLTGMVRTYDRKFLSNLNLKSMDVDINPEILYKAMILRARIVEIPAHLKWSVGKIGGKRRESSIRVIRSIASSLLSGFIFRPFMFFILPGLVLMAFALYPIFWAFIHTFSYYGNVAGLSGDYTFSAAVAQAFKLSPHSFLIGGIAMLLSIQMISLGVLALQNKRYFEELFHFNTTIYQSNHRTDK